MAALASTSCVKLRRGSCCPCQVMAPVATMSMLHAALHSIGTDVHACQCQGKPWCAGIPVATPNHAAQELDAAGSGFRVCTGYRGQELQRAGPRVAASVTYGTPHTADELRQKQHPDVWTEGRHWVSTIVQPKRRSAQAGSFMLTASAGSVLPHGVSSVLVHASAASAMWLELTSCIC